MRINLTKGTLALGLVMSLGACGPKMQTVADSQDAKSDSSSNESDTTNTRETVVVGVSVAEKGAAFRLAAATSYDMSLEGCASGLTISSITQTNPNVSAYKYDQNCLIKLNSFTINGFTYVPSAGDPFASWAAGDIAAFEVAGNPSNNYKVVVGSQLNNPITGTEAVAYTFTQIAAGADEQIASSVVGDSHALSVSGDDAVTMDIVAVTMTGMTAGGAGTFDFKLECGSAVTGSSPNFACGSHTITNLKYKLVEDTFGGVLTAAQAAALFDGSESSIVAGDLLATGASGAPNGGYTAHVTSPNQMHLHEHMLYVIKSGASYRYFNVDVTTLSYP